MFIEQKEFALIFNQDIDKVESFLEDLLSNKDPKFIIYFNYFIDKIADRDPNKVILFFDNYSNSFDKLDNKLIKKYLEFLISVSRFENFNSIFKIYIQNEQDIDEIFDLIKKLPFNNLNYKVINDLLIDFYNKVKGYDFAEIYLKRILKDLRNNNKLLELENFLLVIYNDKKVYWVVDLLVDLYSSKEEYERLLNIFLGIIANQDFINIWAESLGIIDKAIGKIVDQQDLIFKIIPHLNNINVIVDKTPKNVFKIYDSLLKYYNNIPGDYNQDFIKSLINFIQLSLEKNIIDERMIFNLVVKLIEKSANIQFFEKIKSVVGDKVDLLVENLFHELLLKKEYKNLLLDFITSYYSIIKTESFVKSLDSLSLDDWLKIYDLGLLDKIDSSILVNLRHQSLDYFINSLVIKGNFDLIQRSINILIPYLIDKEDDLSLITNFIIKFFSMDYIFVLENISQLLKYPQLIWFVYSRMKEVIDIRRLHRLFIGIFLFYMDTEEEIDVKFLDDIKQELISMLND